MTLKTLWAVAAIAAAVLAAGCKGTDDEFAPAVTPKTFVFEGKVAPKYVGVWKSGDKTTTLAIGKDGEVKIETTTRSIAGKNVARVSGQWLANGSDLMFRYKVGSQEPTVLKYAAALSGNTLTLQQDGGRLKTTYRR